MQAGKLRHRVTLQEQAAGSPQQLPTGEPDVAWVNVATVWAEVRPLGVRERFLSAQTQPEQTHLVRIRYRAGVNAAMRVLFGTRKFDILGVINVDERNAELRLQCREGLNDG